MTEEKDLEEKNIEKKDIKNKLFTLIKGIIFTILWVLLFLVSEVISAVIAFVFEAKRNPQYVDELKRLLGESTGSEDASVEYIQTCMQLIPATLVLTFAFVCIPTFIYLFYKDKDLFHLKSNSGQHFYPYLAFGVSINAVLSFALAIFSDIFSFEATSDYFQMENAILSLPFPLLLLTVGFLAPICEELIFRGIVMEPMMKYPKMAILVSALAFGVAHGNLIQSSYAFVLGLLLGYVRYRYNSLTPSIFLHIGVNASSSLAAHISSFLGNILFIGLFIVSIHFLFQMRRDNSGTDTMES